MFKHGGVRQAINLDVVLAADVPSGHPVGQVPELLANPLEVQVVLFGYFDRTASATISLHVELGVEIQLEPLNKKKRKGLFEPYTDRDDQNWYLTRPD